MDRCEIISSCAMRPLADFIPEIVARVPKLFDEVAAHYVREAAIEFAQRAKVLRQIITVDLQAGVSDVLLEPDCGMHVVSIHKLCADCDCAQHYELIPGRPCGIACDGASVWFVPPTTLSISPSPRVDREGAFWALVSVAPDRDACELPEILYQRYSDRLVVGALSKIHLMKGEAWYDAPLADRMEKKFNAGVTVAALDRLTGHGMGPFPMKPRTGRIV